MQIRHPTVATVIGLCAPVLWGTSVPLIRGIVEEFGITLGEFFLYLLASVYLYFIVGLPDWRAMDKRYKIFGIGVAVLCSLCFVFSIYLSDGGKQTMEVGMVNYLWPAMTILFAIAFAGQHANVWIYPGILLSLTGIFWILGNGHFSITEFLSHVSNNPWSYILAFFGAVAWALYSTLTKLWSNGQNPSTLIFVLNMFIYGGLYLMGVAPGTEITTKGIGSVIFGGLAMASAYAAWTHGVQYGRVTILAIASYFTPVLSCIFGAIWIGAELTQSFWLGVAILVIGSLLCWYSTRS